jgi:hypothetical protein
MQRQFVLNGPHSTDPGPDPPDDTDTGDNSGTKTVGDKDGPDVSTD